MLGWLAREIQKKNIKLKAHGSRRLSRLRYYASNSDLLARISAGLPSISRGALSRENSRPF